MNPSYSGLERLPFQRHSSLLFFKDVRAKTMLPSMPYLGNSLLYKMTKSCSKAPKMEYIFEISIWREQGKKESTSINILWPHLQLYFLVGTRKTTASKSLNLWSSLLLFLRSSLNQWKQRKSPKKASTHVPFTFFLLDLVLENVLPLSLPWNWNLAGLIKTSGSIEELLVLHRWDLKNYMSFNFEMLIFSSLLFTIYYYLN